MSDFGKILLFVSAIILALIVLSENRDDPFPVVHAAAMHPYQPRTVVPCQLLPSKPQPEKEA